MTREEMITVIVLVAPLALVGLAAIARGYHMSFHLWRETRKREDDSE